MTPSTNNTAIIAAAGARKTQMIIDQALAAAPQRVLITTYTNENLRQLERRIAQITGVVPEHITLLGWFSFLLSQGVRPYQRAILRHPGIVRGLNFHGKRPRGASATDLEYFLDVKGNRGVWRDGVSDLVRRIDDNTGGLVIARLEDMFAHIYIDEVQDLVGYDLDVLDLLFASQIGVTVVGDPRQHLFATNEGPRNKKYRGAGLLRWFDERSAVCRREDRAVSYRCHQDICDFASALFPDYPPIKAAEAHDVEHAGVHRVSSFEAL